MSDPKASTSVVRYSDQDLAEFQQIISQKLETAKAQVAQSHAQVMELNESLQSNGHGIDENHAHSEVKFLNTMVVRQNKHIRDLENALLRIKNKSYGICVRSSTLIDKRRLLAVPTTTKSFQSKKILAEEAQKKSQAKPEKKTPKSSTSSSKKFSKVIKKKYNRPDKPLAPLFEEENLDNELDKLDIEEIDTTMEKEE